MTQILPSDPGVTLGFHGIPGRSRPKVRTLWELSRALDSYGLIELSSGLMPEVWLTRAANWDSPNVALWRALVWQSAIHDPHGYWDGSDTVTLPPGDWRVEMSAGTGGHSGASASLGVLDPTLTTVWSHEHGVPISGYYQACLNTYIHAPSEISIVAAAWHAASAVLTLIGGWNPYMTIHRIG